MADFSSAFVIGSPAFFDKTIAGKLAELCRLHRIIGSCRACSLRRAQSSTRG